MIWEVQILALRNRYLFEAKIWKSNYTHIALWKSVSEGCEIDHIWKYRSKLFKIFQMAYVWRKLNERFSRFMENMKFRLSKRAWNIEPKIWTSHFSIKIVKSFTHRLGCLQKCGRIHVESSIYQNEFKCIDVVEGFFFQEKWVWQIEVKSVSKKVIFYSKIALFLLKV